MDPITLATLLAIVLAIAAVAATALRIIRLRQNNDLTELAYIGLLGAAAVALIVAAVDINSDSRHWEYGELIILAFIVPSAWIAAYSFYEERWMRGMAAASAIPVFLTLFFALMYDKHYALINQMSQISKEGGEAARQLFGPDAVGWRTSMQTANYFALVDIALLLSGGAYLLWRSAQKKRAEAAARAERLKSTTPVEAETSA